MFPQLPIQPSTECTHTDTLNSDPNLFFTEHSIKHNHKPTSTPTLTVIAAADNHFLPPFASLELVTSPPSGGGGGTEQERGRVVGGGGAGGREGARGRRGRGESIFLIRRTRPPNWTMNRIFQNMNGGRNSIRGGCG